MATAYRPTPRPKTLTLSTIALVANLAAAGTGTVVQPGIGGNHGSLSSQSASAVQTPAAWPGAKAEYPACEATCPADVYESDGPREGMPVHHENCVHGGAPCRRLPEHVCSLASLWQHTAAPAWPCHPAWPGARRNVGQCPTFYEAGSVKSQTLLDVLFFLSAAGGRCVQPSIRAAAVMAYCIRRPSQFHTMTPILR